MVLTCCQLANRLHLMKQDLLEPFHPFEEAALMSVISVAIYGRSVLQSAYTLANELRALLEKCGSLPLLDQYDTLTQSLITEAPTADDIPIEAGKKGNNPKSSEVDIVEGGTGRRSSRLAEKVAASVEVVPAKPAAPEKSPSTPKSAPSKALPHAIARIDLDKLPPAAKSEALEKAIAVSLAQTERLLDTISEPKAAKKAPAAKVGLRTEMRIKVCSMLYIFYTP